MFRFQGRQHREIAHFALRWTTSGLFAYMQTSYFVRHSFVSFYLEIKVVGRYFVYNPLPPIQVQLPVYRFCSFFLQVATVSSSFYFLPWFWIPCCYCNRHISPYAIKLKWIMQSWSSCYVEVSQAFVFLSYLLTDPEFLCVSPRASM